MRHHQPVLPFSPYPSPLLIELCSTLLVGPPVDLSPEGSARAQEELPEDTLGRHAHIRYRADREIECRSAASHLQGSDLGVNLHPEPLLQTFLEVLIVRFHCPAEQVIHGANLPARRGARTAAPAPPWCAAASPSAQDTVRPEAPPVAHPRPDGTRRCSCPGASRSALSG